MNHISYADIDAYIEHLTAEGLAANTVERYARDVRAFMTWLGGSEVTKDSAAAYIKHLSQIRKTSGVNATVTSLNNFFTFIGWEIKLRQLKNRRAPKPAETELTGDEYARLLKAARLHDDERMTLILQTIYLVGVRVSELRYITVEAARSGKADIPGKAGARMVSIPKQLSGALLQYAEQRGIHAKSIFITTRGNPVHRKNVWEYMKKLCETAQVSESKVCPDNLRYIRAREYCEKFRDVAGLADMLRV